MNRFDEWLRASFFTMLKHGATNSYIIPSTRTLMDLEKQHHALAWCCDGIKPTNQTVSTVSMSDGETDESV